ncbi:M43 family zinc metalloprotease [Chryseobacterium sp. RLHN22]|uniref:M43 family zinc metalloprotease n=1 Tax=Chryseobacterium sp. RLHN22 TaxID=3437885 RepID=UPI003D9BA466
MSKITSLRFLVLAFLSFFVSVNAQKKDEVFTKETVFGEKKLNLLGNGIERCSTVEYEAFLKRHFPERLSTSEFEAWLAPLIEKAQANKSQNGNVITIPVVVHVIHNGQAVGVAPNIVDEQVMSQIEVMNNDFRRLFGTPGYNTNPVSADIEIQFALAKVDPNGNPTNGIDRVNLCESSWDMTSIDAYVKPQTIWDPNQYMNMWSVRFSDSTLLGYAQFPTSSGLVGVPTPTGTADSDGVVANYSVFGSSDYDTTNTFLLANNFDKGRTMTHEVGHFLGLRHIWGDQACGTDYCADTPVHYTANSGCPTHPKANLCGTADEMFENYMDYSYDSCLNVFTNDQKTRMRTVMNNSPRRMQLKSSTKDAAIPLFANDAEIKLERGCAPNVTCANGSTIRVALTNRGTANLTSATISLSINGTIQNLNWTGNLATNKSQILGLPAPSTATNGPLVVSVTAVNGTADQRATNNSATGTFNNGIVTLADLNYVFNLQLDYWGAEVSWNLKNSAGTTVYSGGSYPSIPNPNQNTPLPALITQNWVLNSNDCYTFTINDSYGDGIIHGLGAYYNIKTQNGTTVASSSTYGSVQNKAFKIQTLSTSENVKDKFGMYPNPATDVLNFTKISNKTKFEIHNAVGQLVKTGDINNNQVRVSELVKGTYIITIKDGSKNESVKFIKK